jgi:hypothetical protein
MDEHGVRRFDVFSGPDGRLSVSIIDFFTASDTLRMNCTWPNPKILKYDPDSGARLERKIYKLQQSNHSYDLTP